MISKNLRALILVLVCLIAVGMTILAASAIQAEFNNNLDMFQEIYDLQTNFSDSIKRIAEIEDSDVMIVPAEGTAGTILQANVFLTMRNHTVLTSEQAQEIRLLMSGYIENLSFDHISIMDADGNIY